MQQRLIVEGKDAIVLANICKKRKLSPPKGYSSKTKFIKEFVINGNGYDGALKAFEETLSKPDITQIGLVVDANEIGVEQRWTTLKKLLSEIFPNDVLVDEFDGNGIVLKSENLPVVGIWIMPDNSSNGYLEHFLSTLVPANDQVWQHAQSVINELSQSEYCKFSTTRKQKALVHTWLAWQKEPGKPFESALEADYFDVNNNIVDIFLDWFQRTFALEKEI